MNQAFDYNGVVVAQSAPKKVLRTVKKTIHIDSADRDTTKYFTNGDFWVYLPRTYHNIVSIRLKDAQFPQLINAPSKAATINGQKIPFSGQPFVIFTTASDGPSSMVVGSTVTVSNLGSPVAGLNGTYTVVSIQNATEFMVRSNFVFTSPQTVTGLATVITPGSIVHSYTATGAAGNGPTTSFSSDILTSYPPYYYFLIGLEGLNKVDETAVSGNESTFTDSFFAKIPNTGELTNGVSIINYNDHSSLENIGTYSPPIEHLDRLRVTIRTHTQQDKNGFMYWTSDGGLPTVLNTGGAANFNLTLEIEYLENAFTDFSSFETRLAQRS